MASEGKRVRFADRLPQREDLPFVVGRNDQTCWLYAADLPSNWNTGDWWQPFTLGEFEPAPEPAIKVGDWFRLWSLPWRADKVWADGSMRLVTPGGRAEAISPSMAASLKADNRIIDLAAWLECEPLGLAGHAQAERVLAALGLKEEGTE
jgi:hypothetical protein